LIFTGLVLGSAHAYQVDVHYGLTKWLAIEVGFLPDEAEEIANSNRMSDGHILDAVKLRKSVRSRRVRTWPARRLTAS
jgi:hypothetical protein